MALFGCSTVCLTVCPKGHFCSKTIQQILLKKTFSLEVQLGPCMAEVPLSCLISKMGEVSIDH